MPQQARASALCSARCHVGDVGMGDIVCSVEVVTPCIDRALTILRWPTRMLLWIARAGTLLLWNNRVDT